VSREFKIQFEEDMIKKIGHKHAYLLDYFCISGFNATLTSTIMDKKK
jgi:hypothetical protein